MDIERPETSSEPPERAASALLELPRREPYRTWPGGLLVLAIIVAYVVGFTVADGEIAADVQPVVAGSIQKVGPTVTFVPQDGWSIDSASSSQSDAKASITLVRQTEQFIVIVSPWEGTLAEEVDRNKAIDEVYGRSRVVGEDASFSTAGGLRGTVFNFVNQEDLGRVWVSVDDTADRAISVMARGPGSSFTQSLPDFEAMLNSIRTEQS